MIEKDFVTEGLKRTRIDEFLENELERAGYGGMEIQVTPLGTMVVVYAERPGMVIGRGGKTVRSITQNLKMNYGLENPQVEVKEVEVPELNPKIMAHKIAAMLQRGMHFRRVAYTALRRIMGAGAQGVEVTISGKIRGSRSAAAKFSDGYIKKCGEPSTRFVREGFATVQLKPGVLGIYVRIMPPGIVLPDKVDILKVAVEETPADTLVEDVGEETVESTESAQEIKVEEEAEAETAEIMDEIAEEVEEEHEKLEKEAEESEDGQVVEPAEETVEEPADESKEETSKGESEEFDGSEEPVAKPAEESEEEPAEEEPEEVEESKDEPVEEPAEETSSEDAADEPEENTAQEGATEPEKGKDA